MRIKRFNQYLYYCFFFQVSTILSRKIESTLSGYTQNGRDRFTALVMCIVDLYNESCMFPLAKGSHTTISVNFCG